MNFRQKLVYTLFGALLALVGMLFSSIVAPPVTAQRGTDIVCTSLKVVDDAGNPGVSLSINERGGQVSVWDKIGSLGVSLLVSEHGGRIVVLGKSENPMRGPGSPGVGLSINEHGGEVSVFDKQGNRIATLP